MPAQNMVDETKRRKFLILRSQLELERTTFLSHWRDLGQIASPRRARFAVTDVNRGDRRNQQIIDNAAVIALRTLRAGMMAGVTSPARPWFRLTTSRPELNDLSPVKLWLDQVTGEMTAAFLKSNLYNILPIIYGDIGQFATGAMMVEEDMDDIVRVYPFPIGTYMIACDDKGRVDTFVRDFRMTVKQLVQKFGRHEGMPHGKKEIDWSKLSVTVKNLWENDQRESWVDICHVIRPNDDYDQNKHESKYKKFSSCYFERGASGTQAYDYLGADDDRFLRESGYDYFPVLCPRWEISAEDAYGTSCPGMDALGDNKQLQIGEKRGMQAIDIKVRPPMVAPTSMRNSKKSILPGDVSYVDVQQGQQGFQAAIKADISIVELEQKQQQVRRRIDSAYFKDLFMMFSDDDRMQPPTATEVNEKKQEKLLVLGPVLEQLNQDLLDPLIDITFDIMMKQGRLPEPPQELHGIDLKVEYISIMAQAQKVAGIAGIDRFMGAMAQSVQVFPEVADKINIDKFADIYGDMTSVPPQLIRPDDEVAQMRQQRQKAQQAQQQQEAMAQASQSAKNLSQADMSGNNALSILAQQSQAGSMVPQ